MQIGNIIFEVTGVSQDAIKNFPYTEAAQNYKTEHNFTDQQMKQDLQQRMTKLSIEELPPQSTDRKIRNIAYNGTTGMVVTRSAQWYSNVLEGVLLNGVTEIDFWTNQWLPDRTINKLEVYFQSARVLEGKVAFNKEPDNKESDNKKSDFNPNNPQPRGRAGGYTIYLADSRTVHQEYQTQLYSIGLNPRKPQESTLADFDKMLREAFR